MDNAFPLFLRVTTLETAPKDATSEPIIKLVKNNQYFELKIAY
jgi:hypothetical protein